MGGDLVLVLVNGDSARGSCWPVGAAHPDEDKHQAPSSTPPNPLSLQDGLRLLLHSVVKIHQVAICIIVWNVTSIVCSYL